ncbi:tryptophan synthase beta subunit-like PLP-dependent enzyme [Phialemonium atrogriseum]|uniref:Tryptophan synthase beta subunit-like PLP-dependent enzyme n=1 Tax=Phialemonium atrogriseum TaxID=1093897 RepID=A0AAJ0FD03_9PEZI|nr:tryptophan synthase beta subunit-like PLP-dependent enzyme [Phialemonium atrogriseum]KAK1762672.1 tryptophan synthase beta subunit-like PLP-dependent enzyme [Phialemonium atrogriseum]
MASINPLNVYRGPDSVRNYFDPDSSPPLPLVEIPDCLNPYRKDGVRIYAKMMSMHPANNVKAVPAMNLLEKSVDPDKTKTIIEYSSGSTVISMSMVSRVFYNLPDVRAYLSNKTSTAKLRLMQFFGLDITLFGGPSQAEPLDDRGGIRAAERLAQTSESMVNPNQYENHDNWKAHIRWTGPQIFRQLPEISLICAGMGTSGTMTGLGIYFKDVKPSVFRLGVCTKAGDRVPGPRSYALLAPVEFPWKSSVDHLEHVSALDSYSMSLDLCRQGIICGPSSGFNLRGIFQYIEKRKDDGTLSELAGPDGDIHCVFLCCDLPYQYINEYFDKLGESYFPVIKNERLTKVDLYSYDKKWERKASEALHEFFQVDKVLANDLLSTPTPGHGDIIGLEGSITPRPDATIIDLRQASDFEQFHFSSSVNLPFVHPSTPRPFSDAAVLESLWKRLDATFGQPTQELREILHGKRVLILCYDGDSSRVAVSVVRAKGYVADSIRGGFEVLGNLQRAISIAQEVHPMKDLYSDLTNRQRELSCLNEV